jgi:hypothetical protein
LDNVENEPKKIGVRGCREIGRDGDTYKLMTGSCMDHSQWRRIMGVKNRLEKMWKEGTVT